MCLLHSHTETHTCSITTHSALLVICHVPKSPHLQQYATQTGHRKLIAWVVWSVWNSWHKWCLFYLHFVVWMQLTESLHPRNVRLCELFCTLELLEELWFVQPVDFSNFLLWSTPRREKKADVPLKNKRGKKKENNTNTYFHYSHIPPLLLPP